MSRDLFDVFEELGDHFNHRPTGLALHYPFIFSAVVGLETKEAFEFGSGRSTSVIFDALGHTGGHLTIVSPKEEPLLGLVRSLTHHRGLSQDFRHVDVPPLEFVLHDGSHDAATVAEDLAWIIPRVRPFGLIFVHDPHHSYSGPGVQDGIYAGLRRHGQITWSATTLPYGFGLTVIRIEHNKLLTPLVLEKPAKSRSEHRTVPTPFLARSRDR